MATLTREQLINIIKVTNNNGSGTLNGIQDALVNAQEEGNPEEPDPELSSTSLPWCICGNCKEMPTAIENKCCRRKTCVTKHGLFKKYSLDKDNFIINIKARSGLRCEVFVFKNSQKIKVAYRQVYFVEIWKTLQGR